MRREIASRHYVILDRLPEDRIDHFRRDLQALLAPHCASNDVQPVLLTHATIFSKPTYRKRSHFADPLAEDLSHA